MIAYFFTYRVLLFYCTSEESAIECFNIPREVTETQIHLARPPQCSAATGRRGRQRRDWAPADIKDQFSLIRRSKINKQLLHKNILFFSKCHVITELISRSFELDIFVKL